VREAIRETAAGFGRREVVPHLAGGGATEVLTGLAARLMGYA
jgi:hypothetical protein